MFLFTKQNVRHCEPRQGYIQPPNQQQVLGDFQHFFQMRFYLLWCRGSFESQIAVLQHFRFGQTSDQRSADCYTSDDTFLFWGSWSFFHDLGHFFQVRFYLLWYFWWPSAGLLLSTKLMWERRSQIGDLNSQQGSIFTDCLSAKKGSLNAHIA